VTDDYDVVVLGGGSGGEAVARRLAAADKSVALVEERLVGGECPYFACMPSKAMLHAAAIGMSWPDAIAFRDDAADQRDDSDTVEQLVEAGVEVVRGHGLITASDEVIVGARTLHCGDLVIATGAAPAAPPIEGLDTAECWTSEDALTCDELPHSVAILGGGPVGCELAQIYARFGARVVLVEAADRLLSGEPAFVGAAVLSALRRDGAEVATGISVERVDKTGDGVKLYGADGWSVSAERLVVATGKRPRVAGIGLERLGLSTDGAVAVDDHCRVMDGVWAVGDVTGVAPYTHTANYQARVVAANICGERLTADYSAIPRTVYTDPPAFCVGRTDATDGVVTAEMDLSETARAVVEQRGDGKVRLYADTARRVLVGAAVVGPGADSWAGELTLAIRARIGIDMLVDVVHAFPTFGESLEPTYRQIADRLEEEH
jgi:dihydrolipoamide dehydrogenase